MIFPGDKLKKLRVDFLESSKERFLQQHINTAKFFRLSSVQIFFYDNKKVRKKKIEINMHFVNIVVKMLLVELLLLMIIDRANSQPVGMIY